MRLLASATLRPITYLRSAAGDIQPPSRLPLLPCPAAMPSATGLRGIYNTAHYSRRLAIFDRLIPSLYQESNARHHPRPYSTFMRGTLMGRRVHAVVRLRLYTNWPLAFLPWVLDILSNLVFASRNHFLQGAILQQVAHEAKD